MIPAEDVSAALPSLMERMTAYKIGTSPIRHRKINTIFNSSSLHLFLFFLLISYSFSGFLMFRSVCKIRKQYNNPKYHNRYRRR